jgi:hypothetical protein
MVFRTKPGGEKFFRLDEFYSWLAALDFEGETN